MSVLLVAGKRFLAFIAGQTLLNEKPVAGPLRQRQAAGYRYMQRTFRPRWWKRPICWLLGHQTVESRNLVTGDIATRCLRCNLRTRRHA